MALQVDPGYPSPFSLDKHQIHCIPVKLAMDVLHLPEGNIHRLAKVFHTITTSQPEQRLSKECASVLMHRRDPTITIDVSQHHVGAYTKKDVVEYTKLIREKLGRPVSTEEFQMYGIGQEKGKTRGKTQWVHTSADKLMRFKSKIIPGSDMVMIIDNINERGVGEEHPQVGGGRNTREEEGGAAERNNEERRELGRNNEEQNEARRNRRSNMDVHGRDSNRGGRTERHGRDRRDRSRSRESERRSLSYEPSDRDRYARERQRYIHSFTRRDHGTRRQDVHETRYKEKYW